MSKVMLTELSGLPRRPQDGHKGTFGTVLVVAGSRGMSGAAVLAGSGALRGGAGLVRVACPAEIQNVVACGNPCYMTFGLRQHTDGSFSEGTAEELIELAQGASAVAIGPGLGRAPTVATLIARLLDAVHAIPMVLDADGLFAVSPLTASFGNRTAPLVLTPHPGEFARLTGEPRVEGDSDREASVLAFAAKWRHVLLLKGAGTLVADPKWIYRNTTGNPGMATGGSGDVLTGVIAALLARGMAGFEAAALGAWVHGRAGDLAAASLGQTALTATDLLDFLPAALRELESNW